MIMDNIATFITTALGAGIGGYFTFKIAIWQLSANRKAKLEEDVEPILFELKIEYEKVCDMYWELTELSHEGLSPEKSDKRAVGIIKQDKYELHDLTKHFNKIQSEIYSYSVLKNKKEPYLLYKSIREIISVLDDIKTAQGRVTEIGNEETFNAWLNKKMEALNKCIMEFDLEIRDKYFGN